MTAARIEPTRFTFSGSSDEPLPSRTLTLRGFLGLAAVLTDAGLTPPPAFQQLSERLAELGDAVSHGDIMQRRLCEAVLSGDGDIPALYSAALAEHSAAAPDVVGPIHLQVLAAMARLYAPAAADHYATLRRRFDQVAKGFTSCCRLIEPTTPSGEVINAHPNTVQAWKDSEQHSQTLDSLVEPLTCAAEILRGGQPAGLGGSRAALQIPLLCDVDGLHRRRVFEAWHDTAEEKPGGPLTTDNMAPPAHQPSRCGRWGRLVSIGAELRCAEDPATVELYSAPPAFAVQQLQPAPGSLDNPKRPTWQRVDPCDEEHEQSKSRGPKSLLESLRRRRQSEVDVLTTVLDSEENEP